MSYIAAQLSPFSGCDCFQEWRWYRTLQSSSGQYWNVGGPGGGNSSSGAPVLPGRKAYLQVYSRAVSEQPQLLRGRGYLCQNVDRLLQWLLHPLPNKQNQQQWNNNLTLVASPTHSRLQCSVGKVWSRAELSWIYNSTRMLLFFYLNNSYITLCRYVYLFVVHKLQVLYQRRFIN